MKPAKTSEELKAIRPRRGKKIVSERHARLLAGLPVEQESFLNDPSMIDESMGDVSRRPPTLEEIRAHVDRNRQERAAEYRSMGRTGRELLGDLPPIGYKFPQRSADTSESEAESEKENSYADESMGRVNGGSDEREEEMEKETDETTPIAQQRTVGVAGPSTPPANPPIPSTPPARPNSGFKKPALPGMRGPPRHSTPKANVRPRDSFGTAFNNISIIANNSMQAAPTTVNDSMTRTRKESTGSRGAPTLHIDSIREEVENREELMAANRTNRIDQPADEVIPRNGTFDVPKNGTFDVPKNGTFDVPKNGTFDVTKHGTYDVVEEEEVGEGEEMGEETEEGDQSVQVHVHAIAMRRVSAHLPRDVTMASMDGEEEEEREERVERVSVVGVSMRRESVRGIPPHPHDGLRVPIDNGGRRREEREESEEMEDVEMASVHHSPVRRLSIRPAKRPSLEHPLHGNSSPMAVAMARRNSGLRDSKVRPKVSIATTGRKVSTGSVASSIPFEDLSRSNLSMNSSEASYEEPKTPERTPRTTRLLRQSVAARNERQSQLQRAMPILEEAEAQGGERSDMEEEDDDDMGQRRAPLTPSTPANRLPRLSQKLQSSVDRLSQPRHRHEENRPCSRMISPARAAPVQRGGRLPQPPSPSPARRLHLTLNGTRGMMSGYTPNQRIDTTLMEDEGANAKSGLAPRIKRLPQRDQGRKMGTVLNLSVEQSDIEEIRKAKIPQVAGVAAADGIVSKNTSASAISHATVSVVNSPIPQNQRHDNHSYDDFDDGNGMEEDDDRREDEYEREEEQEEEGDNIPNLSATSDDVFGRPANLLPPTPKSGNGRRNLAAAADRRSIWDDDSDGNDAMERLSRKTSQISVGDDEPAPASPWRRRPPVPRGAAQAAAVAAEINAMLDNDSPVARRTPKTPFRATVARNSDLFSTDTPGIAKSRSFMDTEEEEEWAATQDSVLWRGEQSTEEDENWADPTEDSQISIVEEVEVKERILAPRKLIAPTGTPGVRRSTRTRMKPVRSWLGETAQYEASPSGARRLVGVNEVKVTDPLFVKTGTADIKTATLAKKKTAKQRSIANKKKKEQKKGRRVGMEEDSD